MPTGGHEIEEKIERILVELATNTQVTKDILVQTTKTNGRVTRLEDRANGHDTLHALQDFGKQRGEWWKDKFGTAVIGILCAAVGSILFLILQKSHIIDISVLSAETYDSISQSLPQ